MKVIDVRSIYGILKRMELDLEAKEQFQQKFKVIILLGKGSFGSVY